ncbi:hypothetical protein PF004_g20967 [Phytophthora fragariae]|uniref:Uncharacterized protein n=1 Tax=Phytophthora fragariae TaxID=53985 RepID=A0A6G0N4A3_9STRA|nr:hypothetical protein PF004_g20967 [Phytophthora fragariae]
MRSQTLLSKKLNARTKRSPQERSSTRQILKQLQLLLAAKEDDDDEPGESLKAFHFDDIALRYDTLEAARHMADESDSEDDIDDGLQAVAIMEQGGMGHQDEKSFRPSRGYEEW